PRAGQADNAEELARDNLQVEAAQHGRDVGVLAIRLVQVDGSQHGTLLRLLLPSPLGGRGEKKGSLKAQGADRVEPGGTQRRQHAEQYRDHDGAQVHQQHARRLDVGRDAVEVVDAAVENLLSRHLGEELLDLVDVVGKGQSQRGPEGGSNHAEQEPVDQEDFHHAAVGSAQRFENADVARLLDDDHREDRQDTEASHGDDHE